jgi:hypothetical protein
MTKSELRQLILKSLKRQGFRVRGNRILPPRRLDKGRIRELHSTAVRHRVDECRPRLVRYESKLLERMASGSQLLPALIAPRLVEVRSDSEDELLFRYACLHWSIPVSSGYGRRLRYLVVDDHNSKLIGLFGLGDPVFCLSARDQWIGWSRQAQGVNLHHVMDAFVLGAVPPYSFLLGGKLVAMLAASDGVRRRFKAKYGGTRSLIDGKRLDARLALITTTSALGRSSIYNRIGYGGRLMYNRVGFTRGSGDFHFANGLYGSISEYASRHCEPTAKRESWGTGFRNRREVIKKCLPKIGLSTEWLYHGVEREIFAVPLAENTREFLRGEAQRLRWYDHHAADIVSFFKERWLMPRSRTDLRYSEWSPQAWRLWPE